MSRSSPSTTAHKPAPTSLPTTNRQNVATVVEVEIVRNGATQIVVVPDVAQTYYFHDGSTGEEMRPHRIVWKIAGLAQDERIEVHLHCDRVKAHGRVMDEDEGQSLLARLFPSSVPMKPRARGAGTSRGWTTPQGPFPTLDSGVFRLPSDDQGRINVKYSIRLLSARGELAFLDPGVNLIPDP